MYINLEGKNIYTWGVGNQGQLMHGDAIKRLHIPKLVDQKDSENVISIQAGPRASFIIS